MNLDSLIRASAEKKSAPSGFLSNVEQKINARIIKRQKLKLIQNSALLGAALILFFIAGAKFLTELISLQTFDFISAIFSKPSLLILADGRSAILETLPVLSFVFAIASLVFAFPLIRLLIKDIPIYLYHFSHFHAFSK